MKKTKTSPQMKKLLQYAEDTKNFNKALAKAMNVKNPPKDGKIYGKLTKAEAKYVDIVANKLQMNAGDKFILEEKYKEEKERLSKLPTEKTPRPKGFKKVKYDKKTGRPLNIKLKPAPYEMEVRKFNAGGYSWSTIKTVQTKTADIDATNAIREHVIKNTLE